LTGILFVRRSGMPWQMLPREMGCGSGSTCWRRIGPLATGWRVETPAHGVAHGTSPARQLDLARAIEAGVFAHIHDVPFPYNVRYPPDLWVFGNAPCDGTKP
jgi:transposase